MTVKTAVADSPALARPANLHQFQRAGRAVAWFPGMLTLEIIIALASLWMRTGFPIYAFPDAMLDDGLFIRAAQHLANGDWLGPYDNATLAKGAMYPLFIAGSAWLGLPLKWSEQILYLAVSWGAGRTLTRFTGRRAWGMVGFALLAANPVLWNEQLARVIRDGIYLSETLAVIVLTSIICRRGRPNWRAACLLGLSYGALWLTREEGVWLLPAMLAMLAMTALLNVFDMSLAPSISGRLRSLVPVALCAGVAAGCFAVADVSVCTINLVKYGTFTESEFHSGAFVRAYGALARVQPATWRRYVVFPREVWAAAFAASPAARELQPAFEGPLGVRWQQTAATLSGDARETEILSGWFVWVLRDAAAAAGHYASAPEAAAFYDRLSTQINAACAAGRLHCLPARATLAPPWHAEFIGDTASTVPVLASLVFTMGHGRVGAPPSQGEPSRLEQLADIAGPITRPFAERKIIRGWLASKMPPAAGAPQLDIRPSPKDASFVPTSVIEWSDPSLKKNLSLDGFDFVADSACNAACSVVLSVGGIAKATLPWQAFTGSHGLDAPDVWLNIDDVSAQPIELGTATRRHVQERIGHAIGTAYAILVPIGAAIALIGFVAALASTAARRSAQSVIVLATGALSAIAVRIVLLSFLDATSLPAKSLLYAACVTPAVLLFTTAGFYLLACAFLTPGKLGHAVGRWHGHGHRAARSAI